MPTGSRSLGAAAATAACVALASCAVPAREGNPNLNPAGVRDEYFRPEVVRLHVFSVNGAVIPPEALKRSVATIERHLGRPIEVIDHGSQSIPEESGEGPVAQPLLPTHDGAGRPVTPPPPGSPEYFSAPDRGIIGVGAIDTTDGPPLVQPIVEPGVIVIESLPGPRDGVGVTGFATQIPFGPSGEMHTGMVVLNASVIDRRTNWFVSRERVYEWTITHEIGHVLGVPADNSHTWTVPGLAGLHCTHPECVMYTGIDWRNVLSGVLHGWPLDYCERCSGELDAARVRVTAPGTASR